MTDAPAATSRRRFLLVENPIAGVSRRTLTDDVVRALELRGAAVTRLGAEADLARVGWAEAAARYDAVIAAGGDGTVRALGRCVAATDLPVGLIPRGTGNVLAEEVGLPRTPGAIADLLMSGPVVRIRGARANGEPMFLMAGIGFDGDVVHRLDLGLKRSVGKAAYAMPALAAMGASQPRLSVRIDGGEPLEAGWVVVANARRYGGSFHLSRQAGLGNDGLVVVLFARGGPLRRAGQLLALGAGRLDRIAGVRMLPATRVLIASADRAPVQIDGDAFGAVPVDMVWGEPRLALIVPEAYAAAFAAGGLDAGAQVA
jgi:diacylglycerol kinase family enzyme